MPAIRGMNPTESFLKPLFGRFKNMTVERLLGMGINHAPEESWNSMSQRECFQSQLRQLFKDGAHAEQYVPTKVAASTDKVAHSRVTHC